MRLSALVPAGFLAGAALCASFLRHAPAAVNVDRTQPLVVVTYWHAFGAQMWLALALAITIASVGYVAALAPLDRLGMTSGMPTMTGVVVTSALACAAALLFPVVFSSDAYAYAGYGDMALHGINPYAHAVITHGDPLLDAMVWQWGNPPPMCVYGPAFVWLAKEIVAVFAPMGTAAPLWAFRVLACIALVACAPLAYAAFATFPRATRVAAAAGIALNPVAIWSAAEGHNDTLALAIVLAGFALAARGRPFTGALTIALSALVKAPGAAAAIAFAAFSWPDRSRFARVASGAALGIALVAALAIPLEYGVRAHLAPSGHYLPQFSLQYVSVPLTVVVVALLVMRSVPRVTRGGLAVLLFAAWLAIPNPYPWYAVWVLPVAFLAWDTLAGWALVALSLFSALRYYPDATASAFPHPLGAAIVAGELLVPLALLTAHMASARRDRRESRTPAPGFATPRSP